MHSMQKINKETMNGIRKAAGMPIKRAQKRDDGRIPSGVASKKEESIITYITIQVSAYFYSPL